MLFFRGKNLSRKQMEIVNHMTSENKADIPITIVYGPFGTGKTFTFQAIATNRAGNGKRVLCCTKSHRYICMKITR